MKKIKIFGFIMAMILTACFTSSCSDDEVTWGEGICLVKGEQNE